ncbi:MAG: hypothetical protein M1826_005694 [Phylliscum demangeonii]|nr:MAG: hypothetical protein M1826_005694 [Phylliscum demangeonii]
MDLSVTFSSLLKLRLGRSVHLGSRPPRSSDEFLKEAERISAHINSLQRYLRSIRQPYLSTSRPSRRADISSHHALPPHDLALTGPGFGSGSGPRALTDLQRDQIDAECKRLLREIDRAIYRLSEAEQLRQKAEASLAQRRRGRRGLGVLTAWAAGRAGPGTADGEESRSLEDVSDAHASTVKLHRESVLWYLRRRLEACSEAQMKMMESRLVRELEKGKSRLYSARGMVEAAASSTTTANVNWRAPVAAAAAAAESSSSASGSAAQGPPSDGPSDLRLSADQLQLLAEENSSMLKHYEDTLDQVRAAERSLVEIAELQTSLANNLAVQTAHIDQLVADTFTTSENIGGGNKQLRRATERTRTAKYVFYASCLFSLVLVSYDLLI